MSDQHQPGYMEHVERGLRSMATQPDLELIGGVSVALFHNSTTLVGNGNMNSSVAWWVHDDMNAQGRGNEIANYLIYNVIRNLLRNIGKDVAGPMIVNNLNLVIREESEKPS